MAKKRLIDLIKDRGTSFAEALGLVGDKLAKSMVSGKGKNTWIDEEGQEVLEAAMDVPEAVPKYHKGRVLKSCLNPNYMYVILEETKQKVPVVTPRKLYQKMKGKLVTVEEITDVNGTSYRYVRD